MKKIKWLCLLLASIMLISVFVSCKDDQPDGGSKSEGNSETPAETPAPKPSVTLDIISGGKCNYTVVRPLQGSDTTAAISIELKNALAEATDDGVVSIKEDFLIKGEKPGEFEILLGYTNREESAQIMDSIKYDDYQIIIVGKKIVIAAYNDEQLAKAVDYFIDEVVSKAADGKLTFSTEQEFIYNHTYPVQNLTIGDAPIENYRIVIGLAAEKYIKNASKILVETIRNATGAQLEVVYDKEEATANEFILGNTTRPESAKYYGEGKSFEDNQYTIDVSGGKIVIAGAPDEFTLRKAIEDLNNMITESKVLVSKTATAEAKVLLTTACFSDSHNSFAMLEPTNNKGEYIFRKTHEKAIELILETRGQVDVVMVGGDLMSDYPHWDQSGWWPYKYFVEYKALIVEKFAKLAKDGKVIYIAGNHDYAQGELSTDGPTSTGAYNSSEFYFTGPMNTTMGELDDDDMHWITGTHTGDKYLLGYHYEVNGVHFIGLSPNPDDPGIWSKQGYGFHPDTLKWFDRKLKEIDPNGNEIIFVNCHYHLAHRVDDVISKTGQADKDILPIIKSHSNLFWFFGHVHTGVRDIAQKYTAEMIVHYGKSGTTIDTAIDIGSYGNVASRGPTTVYMGAGRIDYDSRYFNNDTIYGYGGFSYKTAVRTTATPTVCQVMYVTVYEDRAEFQSINVGTYKGHTVDDIVEPYTVYFYK